MDTRGESPRIYSSELGFYHNDTRYLSVWETTINGHTTNSLASELRHGGSTLVISMTNRDLPMLVGEGRIPRDRLLIRRILTLSEDTLYEIIALRNFDTVAHRLQIEHWAGSRFDDIFEVRGYTREKRGRLLAPKESDDHRTISLQYEGLDGVTRSVNIQRFFTSEKIRVSPGLIGYYSQVEIPAKETVFLKSIVSFDEVKGQNYHGHDFEKIELPEMMKVSAARGHTPLLSGLSIETDNAIVNRAIQNARIDVQMLLTQEGNSTIYPYAGIPWFSAPFGRDGIITAYQMLPWYPKIAQGVLNYVFANLGSKQEAFTDEQPGKVFHENRYGEMANMREIPYIPYYGSVDSTPLALILLHEYICWSMDLDRLKEWWPFAMRAMAWLDNWGDPRQDGFIEYSKQSVNGLVNQGWKDSHDSIMHADGQLAQAPIRLCEVQGYAFRARMGMAALARLLGHEDLAAGMRLEALRLRTRFTERFWDAERRYAYLALDGNGAPCKVLSSNMGHCLWGRILSPEQAASITDHMMSGAMFSGHGVRTLADTEVAFNPMSYHNGSVWPHDNSMILEGLRYYDRGEALETLASALIGVLESSHDFRLPELYCGFRKRAEEPPIPYEVACKPQAWAAGSIFLMLKSLIGISMESDQSHVVFHAPNLTPKINTMEIKGLRGRDWEMDLFLRRGKTGTHVEVTRRSGKVRVLTVT